MKKNIVPLVVIALVVAVAATAIFYGLIVSRMDAKGTSLPGGSAEAAGPAQPRLVANGNFDKGHVLGAGDVRPVSAPNAPPGPAKAEELVGRTLLAKVTDGQLLSDALLTPYRRLSLGGEVPKGMRAVTVHIADSSSVVDLLEAGDRVDLMGVWVKHRYGQMPEVSTRTVLEDVLVYQLGAKHMVPGQAPKMVLTVLATPAQAEKILQADASAQLRVTLRNRADRLENEVPQVTSRFKPLPTAATGEWEAVLVEVDGKLIPTLAASNLGKPQFSGGDWSRQLDQWTQKSQAKVHAVSRLRSSPMGEVAWKAPQNDGELRLRLTRRANQTVRIEPLTPDARGIWYDLPSDGAASALISNLVSKASFGTTREMVVIVRSAQ